MDCQHPIAFALRAQDCLQDGATAWFLEREGLLGASGLSRLLRGPRLFISGLLVADFMISLRIRNP